MRTSTDRNRPKRVLVFLFAVTLAASAVAAAWGQSAPAAGAGTGPAEPAVTAARPTEAQANLIREDLEAIQALIDSELAQVRIAESRLEQARKWETHYSRLLKDGKVTEDRYLAAKDDVLMLEAHVASEKADVKLAEMRMRHLQRRLGSGAPSIEVEYRLSDVLQRLTSVERKLDLLQHEVGRIRREMPGESPTAHR